MTNDGAAVGVRAMRVLASRLVELKLPRGGQKRLAELAGVTEESIIRWRNGEGNPRLSQIEALADAMGVSVVYLVSSESAERPTLPSDDERTGARVARLMRKAEQIARELTAATEAARSRKP